MFFKYLWYIIRHKWYVGIECLKIGLPIWVALGHDLSKLLPDEFIPYMKQFYSGRQIKDENGEFISYADFDMAWNHHQKRNPHHWQYWLLTMDSGKTFPLEMPARYWKEMVADWRGMSKTVGGTTLYWYSKNRDKIQLHPTTRRYVEDMVDIFNRGKE